MKTLVSVCCITYNQEKYIGEAIESFLMQKTNFGIEIIVNDDCSTDKTAEIIETYEKKHPELIRAIYQSKNQYSKGKKPLDDCILPFVNGKYLAICEGDDYWTDKYKLQKQVDFLENNSDYGMCFHKVRVVDVKGEQKNKVWAEYLGRKSRQIPIRKIGVPETVHLSSTVIKTNLYKVEKPKWVKNAIHGDYALALYMAVNSKVFFINEIMSAYRSGVANSLMTKRKKQADKSNEINYQKNRIETLKMADECYGYEFNKEFTFINMGSELKIKMLEKNLDISFFKNLFNYIYGTKDFKILKTFIFLNLPKSVHILKILRNKLS